MKTKVVKKKRTAWRSVQTPPDSIRDVLVASAHGALNVAWYSSSYNWLETFSGKTIMPTHWCPLPKAPKAPK